MRTKCIIAPVRLFAVFAAAALLMTACGDGPAGGGESTPAPTSATPLRTPLTSPAPSLPVITIAYEGGSFTVEVARAPEERALGLGGRSSLPANVGMLFDLGETRVPVFSMRGMLFPLDFVWIDEAMRITEITPDVPPPPSPDAPPRSLSPSEPVRWVLEVNAGTAARVGLAPGDQLEFEPP